MFLTKIWFFLIALLSAVAVTFALVAPRPVVQKLSVLEGQRLDRAQYAAEQMFKVDAHKWIDRVGKLGRDAIISESLDAASRGSGEYGVIHRTIQDRFRTLIPDLASGGIDVITAVDNKGRVIARVGDNDKEYGDYINGAELVADALRGYLSDDVWGIGGKLQRVAAAPVLSKGRDRIVGAIYVGAETGDALVERLKKNLDVDVALLLRGKVIASSRAPGEVDALPELIGQHTQEIEAVKRTPALSLTAGQEKLLVVAAPFPGQAGEQQAYYALIGVQPAKTDLRSLLSNTTSDDLKWGHFPWLPVGLGRARDDRVRPVPAAGGGGGAAAEVAARPAEAGLRRHPEDPGLALRRALRWLGARRERGRGTLHPRARRALGAGGQGSRRDPRSVGGEHLRSARVRFGVRGRDTAPGVRPAARRDLRAAAAAELLRASDAELSAPHRRFRPRPSAVARARVVAAASNRRPPRRRQRP